MKIAKVAILIIAISIILTILGCFEDAIIKGIVISDPVEPPINREEILDFLGEDATDEEIQRHVELVVAAAVNVNLLDISGCAPNPLVIEVGYGESIEIKNSDTTDHTLHHGEASITIPAGGTRGIVGSDFVGIREGDGIAGYACDNTSGGIFYINSNLVVKPSEKQGYITFKVVKFLLPNESSHGVEGARVTRLDGSGEVRETAPDGSVTFRRNLPLTVRLEKEDGSLTTEVTVVREWEEVVLPSRQKNITFRVVEPLFPNDGDHPDWPDDRNGPGIEGVRVTCLEGSDEGVKETTADGSVTFFGTFPLTIRIEKPGYITTETAEVREEVVFPNEWPPEAEEAIRQLGLAEAIASGELILRWGDEEYLTALGDEGLGGIISCSGGIFETVIIVQKSPDRRRMVWTLVHEAMHARQGYDSINPPCGTGTNGAPSEDDRVWSAALKKDLLEIGPIPDFDDRVYGPGGKLLSELPGENQADFYPAWYMGREGTKEELDNLYTIAPNRCKYFEDRFGPPPPRQ